MHIIMKGFSCPNGDNGFNGPNGFNVYRPNGFGFVVYFILHHLHTILPLYQTCVFILINNYLMT